MVSVFRRGEVLDWVIMKYGQTHVRQPLQVAKLVRVWLQQLIDRAGGSLSLPSYSNREM